ncbi:MAG: MBL fold metallo-hydrolase, partial [Natronospirillum sp.]
IPLGILLNLILIPWVTLVALPAAFLTALYVPGAAAVFVFAVSVWDFLLHSFDRLWTLFVVLNPVQAVLVMLCCGAGLVFRFNALHWALLAVVTVLLHWHNGQPPKLLDDEFDLWVLDTGQAQSVVIETAAGRVLYDTGFGDPATVNLQQAPLRWHWRWPGGQPWHAVILSHNDADHAGGLASVALAITPKHVFTGQPPIHPPELWPSAQFCDQGAGFTLANVAFEFKRPVAGYMPVSSNDASCVLSVRSASGSVLILGDAGKRVEYALLQNRRLQPVDLLMSGHHGSDTSTSFALLEALGPRWVVHSAAAWRLPERPDPRVVSRVQAVGAVNHCTCWSGALRYQFRRNEIIQMTYGNRLLPWLKIGPRAHPVNDS